MIDGIEGPPPTQLHALKFEGQAQQEKVQQVQNETVQTAEESQTPDNKPDHRGTNIDVSA